MDVVRRLNADYGDRMKDGNYSDLIFGRRVRTRSAPPYERELEQRPVTTAIFDAHHHLWDTRVLDYALFRSCPALDRPFLLAEYEREAAARRDRVALGRGRLGRRGRDRGSSRGCLRTWPGAASSRVSSRMSALERREGELDRVLDYRDPPVVGVRRSFEFEEPEFPLRAGSCARRATRRRARSCCRPCALSARASGGARARRRVPRHAVRARSSRQAGDQRAADGSRGRRSSVSLRSGQTWPRSSPVSRPRPTVALDPARPAALRRARARDVRPGAGSSTAATGPSSSGPAARGDGLTR